jgi:hypothetical protein
MGSPPDRLPLQSGREPQLDHVSQKEQSFICFSPELPTCYLHYKIELALINNPCVSSYFIPIFIFSKTGLIFFII